MFLSTIIKVAELQMTAYFVVAVLTLSFYLGACRIFFSLSLNSGILSEYAYVYAISHQSCLGHGEPTQICSVFPFATFFQLRAFFFYYLFLLLKFHFLKKDLFM